MSGWVHDAAIGLGAAITGIVLSSFAGVLIGKWIARNEVAGSRTLIDDLQHLRRSDEEQSLRDGDPQRFGRLSVGGQVSNFDHIVGDTDAAA